MNLETAYLAIKAIGFGEYEARAYCTLLTKSPANGYQVAARSGIPRAKIYQTLDRLVVRGAAVRVETANKDAKVFVAVDPETLILDIQKDTNEACEHALKEMRRLQSEPGVVEFLCRITSREDLVQRARTLTDGARKTLHVALWAEEFDAVLPNLIAAAQRKLRMAVLLYSQHQGLEELQHLGAGAVSHGKNKLLVVPELGRQFVLAADRKECITGSIFEDGAMDGIYSRNRGLVSNTVDLVNHEIYLERVIDEVGSPVTDMYDSDLSRLNSFDSPQKIKNMYIRPSQID
ncbi:TrmB family transcriptional regulator [candidate division KSB1 bacterium]|nr:TrmB family transcriptional regulator [candidate division KSB1 bacterium]